MLMCQRVSVAPPPQILFFWNPGKNHWNLVRVVLDPDAPLLEVFEPMGKPTTRGGREGQSMSFRSMPRAVVHWLDRVAPFPAAGRSKGRSGLSSPSQSALSGASSSWQSVARSAIPAQHQETGFDCGVACLLYAERAAAGWHSEDIREFTNQKAITQYRDELRGFLLRSLGTGSD